MIEFSPISVVLKTGQTAIIRPVEVEDLPGLRELELEIVGDGQGVVRDLSEVAPPEKFIEKHKERWWGERATRIVGMVDGVLAASGELTGFAPSKLRHVGIMAMGVGPSYQGAGLGRAILNQLIILGRTGFGESHPPIRRVELYTRADNARAISLYKSAGFEVEGCRRNFVCLGEGAFVDDIIMGKLL